MGRPEVTTLLAILALAAPAAATVLPTGFVETVVTDALESSTAAAHAPDGRIFVANQGGTVDVVKGGVLLDTPFAIVPADATNERGLLGITLHPDFPHTPWVYVYYSALGIGANRVSRFTADGDVAVGGEQVLVELPPYGSADIHMGGALHFGSDGLLYVAVGDHVRSTEAQLLTSVVGKLLRFDENGAIPASNPFFGSTTGLMRSIWALGLRNPFTFAFHPTNGRLFIDDVGQSEWEEIDEGQPGANYGWPESEGPTDDPRFVTPIYAYLHGPGSQAQGCAISGGTFYAPPVATFPAPWVGRYFFADFCSVWIRWIDPASPTSADFFAIGLRGRPVDLDVGADGSLYVLGRLGEPPREDDVGIITRITYTGTRAPQITLQPASQTVFVGDPVTFVVGAADADTLQWQRNNADIPGATGTTYTIPAVSPADDGATFRAVASNAHGSTPSDAALLHVTTDQAPVATIDVDAPHVLYRAGDHIIFSGTATDLEDGPLGPAAFTWTVSFHHDTHFHPVLLPTSGVAGGEFTVPTTGETSPNVSFRIVLSVEDSGGRTGTATADVSPELGTLSLESSPSGLRVDLDGQPQTTPLAVEGVVGMSRLVSTPATQFLGGGTYHFHRWSDRGERSHAIDFPAGATVLTAEFDGPPTTLPTTTTVEASTTTTESASTTTAPASSTTTSTLPSVCQTDADCDDGDACTSDGCTPGGCEHLAATGLVGAECLLAAALSTPLCTTGTIDPKLEQFATEKLARALELVRAAADATTPNGEGRLLDKARKPLGRIVRQKPGATTDDCLQAVAAQVDAILDGLQHQ